METITQAEPAEYGLTLPEGWTLWFKTAAGSALVHALLVGVYVVKGWRFRFEGNLTAPFTGPASITVDLVDAEGAEMAIESDGITLEVMRLMPLGEARKVLSEWSPKVLAALVPEAAPQPLPARVVTPRDYALVAAEYVRLVNSGERRPILVMAEASGGISKNTMNARIRRARDQGFILQTETGAKLRAELSPRAIAALNEEEN